MKRRAEDLSIACREWRRHRARHVEANLNRSAVGVDPFEATCVCDDQVGRFRKTRGLGCLRSRCSLCKSEKYPKRKPSRPERTFDRGFREQLSELCRVS